ncbi:hypothetical protein A1Q2_01255 [Trichosporon asahii var. asahii CBS 8904]|uniref:Uncharacterized protein n=1 Tax=Trichosporon asahii var. asahii (strain CBS 8904) TaxID=1220162 RepID=K1WU92_TRIAC|nr:hypothetical protein A1Q2_01255 [Trichosporon asahii var. asahii CBS 8904]
MCWLDFAAYPHIVEEILDLAPAEAIPTLRQVSRGVRDRLDRRLAYHVVLPHYLGERAPRLLPNAGQLLTRSSLTKTRIVQLQSWSGQDGYPRTAAEEALLDLPGLRWVVLDFPSQSHRRGSMPVLRAGQTAVHPIRNSWSRQVNHPYRLRYQDVVGCRAHRIVFVLQADPSVYAPICSVFYDSSFPSREFVICLLPPPGDPTTKWLTGKCTSHAPLLDTLAVSAANLGTLTIAGLETWDDSGLEGSWRDLLTERLSSIVNGTTRRDRAPDLTVVTLDEWRQQVGEEEWSLVTSVLD